VVDGEVDPLEIRRRRGNLALLRNSQDLASPPLVNR
jgi:hypothetical protein